MVRHPILPPRAEKRKARVEYRSTHDRESLVSRLLSWRHKAHSTDPLAAVRPPNLIIDDKDIHKLARIHPSQMTDHKEITNALDETREWETDWSKQIFTVIQQFDQELDTFRKTATTNTKNRQKRARYGENIAGFEAATKETEERIRQQVLRRVLGSSIQALGDITASFQQNTENISYTQTRAI